MIVFHAGMGPDSQAVGIALEEGFLDYRTASGEPVPSVLDGSLHIKGMDEILPFLAGQCGRFLPEKQRAEATKWVALAASGTLDRAMLDRQLAGSRYILGEFSIADMAVYPVLAHETPAPAHANIARWAQRMSRRSASGRGMGAVRRTPS